MEEQRWCASHRGAPRSTSRRRVSGPDRKAPALDTTAPHPAEAALVVRLRAAGCVFAEEEARLLLAAPVDPAERESMVARRVAGSPLEHVLGWAEFHGRRWAVDEGVFVPRRRTEFLVDRAVELTAAVDAPVVLDLCCGAGAIGGAVVAGLASAGGSASGSLRGDVPGRDRVPVLQAVDLDPAATAVARANLPGGHVHTGDLYDPLPADLRGRVDVIVVVAPYVPSGAIRLMPPEARTHEPAGALDGGPDGLDVVRRVLAGAATWLAPGGHALLEIGDDQTAPATAAAGAAGLTAWVEGDEDATVLVARQSRSAPSGGA